MKNLKVYQYPKCSTCVKALKFLRARGQDFEPIDITERPPSKAEMKRMLQIQGGEIKKLFNTSGIQYRELRIADRLPNMSNDEAISLLAGNGRLVKRPFVISNVVGILGFKEADWKDAFQDIENMKTPRD